MFGQTVSANDFFLIALLVIMEGVLLARSSHRLNVSSYRLPQSPSSDSAMPAEKYARAAA